MRRQAPASDTNIVLGKHDLLKLPIIGVHRYRRFSVRSANTEATTMARARCEICTRLLRPRWTATQFPPLNISGQRLYLAVTSLGQTWWWERAREASAVFMRNFWPPGGNWRKGRGRGSKHKGPSPNSSFPSENEGDPFWAASEIVSAQDESAGRPLITRRLWPPERGADSRHLQAMYRAA